AYQGKSLTQETSLIFVYEKENLKDNTNNSVEMIIPDRIVHEATLLTLESDDHKMELMIRDYINKKKRNHEVILENNEIEQIHTIDELINDNNHEF
ncbi:9361_t:CDS:2, partial [Funneliformis geosporum]